MCRRGASLLASGRGFDAGRAGCATAAGRPGVVFDRTSPFGRVLVIDEGARRVMRFGSPTAPSRARRARQSARRTGRIRALRAAGPRPPRPAGARVDGGPGRRDVHHAGPPRAARRDVDAVEIDPVVVAAARAHFGLREDARYRVHVADAADWLRARSRRLRLRAAGRVRGRRDSGGARVAKRSFATSRGGWRPAASSRSTSRRCRRNGIAPARAFTAALTPFDCRRTAVDGNVLLFAAVGPARGRPGRHAALARRLGCARRDRFLAGGAGGAPIGGAACDRLLGAAVRARREAVRPGLDAGDARSAVSVSERRHHARRTGARGRQLVQQKAHRGIRARDQVRRGVIAALRARSCPSGMSPSSRPRRPRSVRSRPPGGTRALSCSPACALGGQIGTASPSAAAARRFAVPPSESASDPDRRAQPARPKLARPTSSAKLTVKNDCKAGGGGECEA